MSKEYVIGLSVGFALVLAPLFAFGCIEDDWVKGARMRMSVGSLVSALGSVILLAKATRRLLIDRHRRLKGDTDVLCR